MASKAKPRSCPDCGMELPADGALRGLCPKVFLREMGAEPAIAIDRMGQTVLAMDWFGGGPVLCSGGWR